MGQTQVVIFVVDTVPSQGDSHNDNRVRTMSSTGNASDFANLTFTAIIWCWII